jgi:hypothetical protein
LCLSCQVSQSAVQNPNAGTGSTTTGPPCSRGHFTSYGAVAQPCKCDVCGAGIPTNITHMRCAPCGYDLCISCGLKPVNAAPQAPMTQTVGPPDAKGHTTQYGSIPQNSQCDGCGKAISANLNHPRCAICGFDYCLTCAVSPPNAAPMQTGPQQEGPIDARGHKTFYTSIAQPASCDVCRSPIAQNTVHPRCVQCQYDVCLSCAVKPQAPQQNQGMGGMFGQPQQPQQNQGMGGMFGQPQQPQQNQGMGGMFGQPQQPQQNQGMGGLFNPFGRQ